MSNERLYRALIAVTCVAALIAVIGWTRNDLHATQSQPAHNAISDHAPELPAIPTDAIDSLATALSDHDPFRFTREPSTVPYAAELNGAPPSPPPPAKPLLAVSGTVGPPWVAVLEGVPGHEGSLLAKVGDTVSRAPLAIVTVRAVRHDTVVVRAADTTWTLVVRHPWQ